MPHNITIANANSMSIYFWGDQAYIDRFTAAFLRFSKTFHGALFILLTVDTIFLYFFLKKSLCYKR